MTMVKKKNVPALRFPEFSKEEEYNSYKKYNFQDVFIFSTGKNIKQKEASPEFEIPCVRYGELYHMYNEVIYKIINKTNLSREELLFSKGDEILLPSAGEDPLDIGSASALTLEDVAIGRTINILRPKVAMLYSQIFVSYYINQKLNRKIARLAKGVSISNVYNSDLKKLEIILPNLKEQQKIAKFLTTIDKKIQQLTQKKILLTEYKKGVMQKIFKQEIRFKPDLSGAEGDERGKVFPKWEVKRLGEIGIFLKGKGISKSDISEDGDLECIRYGELYTHYNEVITEIKSKTRLDSKSLVLSKKNDVIIPASGETQLDIATASCVINEGIALGGDLNIIRTKLNGIFLSYYLNNAKKITIASLAQGSSVVHLYPSQLKLLKISFPSEMEQNKIAKFLTEIDVNINRVNEYLNQTQGFKKGLLQKMFV